MTARAWAFQRGILWAIDLTRASPAVVSARAAARFAEVGRESLEPLARAMDLRAPDEAIRRFEAGVRCFVGWLADEIVTYGWLSQHDEYVGELERVYRMLPGDAYIWHCETAPAYRSQGLYGALLSYITGKLRGESVRRVWIGANLENQPSLRGFARAGFLPVVEVAHVRVARLCCLWLRFHKSAPSDFVDGARHMLIAPHERAWRSLVLGLLQNPP
jgi:GNAT superfamily N-acetyltransferase